MGRDADTFFIKNDALCMGLATNLSRFPFCGCIVSRWCPTMPLGGFSMFFVLRGSCLVVSCHGLPCHDLSCVSSGTFGLTTWMVKLKQSFQECDGTLWPGEVPTEVDQCLQLCLLQQRHITSHDDRAIKTKSMYIYIYMHMYTKVCSHQKCERSEDLCDL